MLTIADASQVLRSNAKLNELLLCVSGVLCASLCRFTSEQTSGYEADNRGVVASL